MGKKDRDCGLCGEESCAKFKESLALGNKKESDCPFNYSEEKLDLECENVDTHGNIYDFLLTPVEGEPSARKIIRPFRTDLIEKLNIKVGDIVIARPMGAGCPVTHVLKVYDIDELAGLLYTWVVGPKYARDRNVKDIKAYSMVGFEGIIKDVKVHPKIGKTAGFMPNFCMLRLTHYGLVNKVLKTSEGMLVRIEDIHIAKI